ncbi:hypothetical protein GCM10027063_37010 [Promicromonospora xylanilytica]
MHRLSALECVQLPCDPAQGQDMGWCAHLPMVRQSGGRPCAGRPPPVDKRTCGRAPFPERRSSGSFVALEFSLTDYLAN